MKPSEAAKMGANTFHDSEPTQLDRIADLITQHEQLDRIESDLAEIKAMLTKKKRVAKPKGSTELIYDSKFQAIWKDYPKGHGGNKAKAYIAYQKRLSETKRPLELMVNIHAAVIKYSDFIKATGQSIKHPATFFGPERHYLNDFTPPKQTNGQPEVFSQAHQQVDVSKIGRGDADLDDSQNPYAEEQ